MLRSIFSCIPSSKDRRRSAHASRFQKRRNSLRGNFVTKYTTPIEDDYVLDEATLGRGSFGIVVKAYKNSNSRAFAVKFISKVGRLQRIEREIKLLTDLDHANIIRLFSVYDSDSQVAFVLDLCTGGDLTQVVARVPSKYLPEEQAKIFIRQLVSAVAHIHSRGICHRDIKLQNILLENMDNAHSQIKLIDFGFATRFVGVTPMKTRCGTPYTTAPEVFRESYDERCDVWSVGVVSYFLLCGHRPFTSVDLPGELKKAGRASIVTSILLGRYHFNYPAFRRVSAEGISFIQKLLAPKYTSRWHAVDAMNCPWLSENFVKSSKVDLSSLKNKDTALSQAVSNLRGKGSASVLGNTGMVAVAFDHSRYDAPEIRTLFQYFDKENAGFLSNKAFKKAMKTVSPDLTNEEIESLFHAIDVDNDKQISFTEFLAATMDPREVDTQELSKAFELLDSKGKGYLTVDDFYRVLAVNPDRSSKLQLKTAAAEVEEEKEDSGSGHNLSSSGIPYFEETSNSGDEKINLLKKIAEMIDQADTNNDGVLSYSEFLLGVLGYSPPMEVEEEPPRSSSHMEKIEKEKQRLQLLLDSPKQDLRRSFFQRSFSAQHRRTVPSPSLGDVKPGPPLNSPSFSPQLSMKPKSMFSLGISKLRSPKTVPVHTCTSERESTPYPNKLDQALPHLPVADAGDQSLLNVGGVSAFFEIPSDTAENDKVGAKKEVLDAETQEDEYYPATKGSPTMKGPPMWLVPTIPSIEMNRPKGVVRLPPIV